MLSPKKGYSPDSLGLAYSVQIVSHDSDAPDVHFLVIGLHAPYFRGHVNRSPADGIQFPVGEDLADPEVRQFQHAIRSIRRQ